MAGHIVACDAGGTMTDVIVIDEKGAFVIGKAPTTPQDLSKGYWESLEDAFGYWGVDFERDGHKYGPGFSSCRYTGTAMLNTLISRKGGKKVGLLVTRGFEDILLTERGKQATAGYDNPEIFHIVYRKHNEPLVPKRCIRGITERMDLHGRPAIPLYEHDVRQAVAELLDEGVEVLAIVFLQSFKNSAHELRAAELAQEVMKARGVKLRVYTSHEIAPVIREVSRANSVLIQAFAGDSTRHHLDRIEERLRGIGFPHNLQTVLSYGTICDIRYPRLYESLMSGPVGGIMGAQYLGQLTGMKDIVTTDVGGTSFDVGCITDGTVLLDREPQIQRMWINLPMVDVKSIGTGNGTFIRLDPGTGRIKLGPDSGGADPGPVAYDMGNEIPTVADCNLILGILNKDYYLGGKVKLNMEKALRVFKEKIADPLGADVYQTAEGIIDLMNSSMRDHIRTTVLLGRDPSEYVLLAFGGAGPMHMAGYAGDTNWKGVCTVPFAAAFSAWGCACMDCASRFHKSISLFAIPNSDAAARQQVVEAIKRAWADLEETAYEEMRRQGYTRDQITFSHMVYMRYIGQIDDVEVPSDVVGLNSAEDMERLIDRFEDVYSKTYTMAARSPEVGYQFSEVAVLATVPTMKPTLPVLPMRGEKVPEKARKGTRRVFHRGVWHEAQILEMDEILPGNEIRGIAVIEAPNTTLFVPPNVKVVADERCILWLNFD